MLTDFGLSKEITDDEAYVSTKFGCIYYQAPEVLIH